MIATGTCMHGHLLAEIGLSIVYLILGVVETSRWTL